MTISAEMLNIIACPKCKGDIRLAKDGQGLVCEKCNLLYAIQDGIPILLIDEAKELKETTNI